MGLDWLPGNKPQKGHEKEFENIFHLVTLNNPSNKEELIKRFFQISISPYETLSAPQVGIAPEATEWAINKYKNLKAEKPLAQWLEEMKGYYVLELLPPCDGFPRYSNSPLGYVDRYSFRGDYLKDCEHIIGGTLIEEAIVSKLAKDFLQYGKKLQQAAEKYAKMQNIKIVPPADDDVDSDIAKLDILISATKWCTFWAERGHILQVDW